MMATIALSTVSDPMLYGDALPRVVTLFPLGQSVEISTNSEAVEVTSRALWHRYPRLFDTQPISLRIVVSDRDAERPHAAAVPRGQGHLVSLVSGSDNFATADLKVGYGFVWLTRDVAANHSMVSWNFLEPLVCMMVAARHFSQVHGACISLNGRGVVLCGDSGAGKTCLAYACARTGWRLVSGDAIQVVRSSHGTDIVGRPYSVRFRESARELFPELRNRRASRSPHGKVDIEIDTDDLAIESELTTQASHVVFLNRVAEPAEPFVESVSFEDAFSHLAKVVLYGDESLRAAKKRSLAELLDRPVLRLTYSDLHSAERALRRLVA